MKKIFPRDQAIVIGIQDVSQVAHAERGEAVGFAENFRAKKPCG